MLKNAKLKLAAAALIAGVSVSSYAVWASAFTLVYYTDASKSQVSGYIMHYCQTTTRKLVGTTSAHKGILMGGSCQGHGIPPAP